MRRALREQGIAHVVISLGAEGALWLTSGEWIAKPPAVDVVSTVGAGDSMVGGLIYGLLMRGSANIRCVWRRRLPRWRSAVMWVLPIVSPVGAMMAHVDLQPFNGSRGIMKTLLIVTLISAGLALTWRKPCLERRRIKQIWKLSTIRMMLSWRSCWADLCRVTML